MSFINQAGDEREQDFIDQKLLKDKQDADLVSEQKAQAQIDAILNDKNLTNADLNRDLLDDDRFTAKEKLENMRSATGIADSAEGLLAPSVAASPELQSISDGITSNIASAIEATPQAQLIDSIPEYKADPTATLINELGLSNDRENPNGRGGLLKKAENGLDPNQLKNMISDYATEFNVTEEVAAVAMRKAFIRDPLGANNLSNRFRKEDVGKVIQESLSQKNISDHRNVRRRAEEVKIKLNRLNQDIIQLQQRAAKGGNRAETSQQIADKMLEMTLLQKESNEMFGVPN
ncbi:hypothetical protein SUFG_00019 [Sulfitobacter phage phiCB2047-B]|uniref:Uncharacterized protein n=1 Tax=Sulfitobacter phage phiCB2047-B TaxID=754046 RepID=M4PRL9_9CAUD|nr:hypothetical protein SUFG_00019 [Sulfitobacter phage phiCB2047-B]AGH07391.1 hypothetical protein SUFG_00019 [Sulfitobacter phage phiCB2047-B]